jgi:hypothetical protein
MEQDLDKIPNQLTGAWEDAQQNVIFLFPPPDNRYGKPNFVVKWESKFFQLPYFISYVPINRAALNIAIPFPLFEIQDLMIDFISPDTLELKNPTQVFTLRRLSDEETKPLFDKEQ